LRGDGNNLYQHALIAAGGRLNALRRMVQQRRRTGNGGRGTGVRGQWSEGKQLTTNDGRTPTATVNPPALQGAWVQLLASAQPRTDALAHWMRSAIEPLEAAGWGDELLCYARRLGEGKR
jgi:hypothetical protein